MGAIRKQEDRLNLILEIGQAIGGAKYLTFGEKRALGRVLDRLMVEPKARKRVRAFLDGRKNVRLVGTAPVEIFRSDWWRGHAHVIIRSAATPSKQTGLHGRFRSNLNLLEPDRTRLDSKRAA